MLHPASFAGLSEKMNDIPEELQERIAAYIDGQLSPLGGRLIRGVPREHRSQAGG